MELWVVGRVPFLRLARGAGVFEEARLEQLWYPRMVGAEVAERQPCPYRRREMAEMIWLTLHDHALRFLEGVPATRQPRVRFEDLVRAPQRVMRELSGVLGLDSAPGLLA